MIDVFISYASEDRERVRPLVEALERSGWEVWWDRQIGAGSAFDREIEKAIDSAKCIIVAWSDYSVESEWVRTEANEGLEKGNLVPVALDEVRPPLAFRRIQTIDFSGGTALDEVRDAVGKFAQPAAQDLGDLTPFVGRAQEKERAEDILSRVSEKEGKTLLIGGEVGVGKTRLVRELGIAARNRGFIVLYGRCVDMDGATPYQPLLEQVAQAVRISTPENMRRSLGENAPEVAKLMPELRQQFNDIDDTPELPPDQERRYLLNGVGDFIDRGARTQPMMLVYEDLHWADDSTCILLRHLAERLKESPIFIVGTYRDDELDPNKPFANTLRELNRERLSDDILLKCLDKDGVQGIIEARARKSAPQELVDLVYTETEGNPFFVEEVFRHLEEVGKLFDADGNFLSGVEIKDTEVPRGVQLVIGERLNRVSDTCRQVLTMAAVAGRTFGFDLLLRAGGKLDEDDILDAIEDADAAGLIEDMSREREARYGFVHEQIRQSLLMALSLPRRQRVHLRIADALEEIYGGRADEFAGELSYHLYQAGASADPDKTAHYLTQAGKRAIDSLAFEDAVRRLDSALEIVRNNDAQHAETLRLKAAAECGMGKIDDSLKSLDEAAELAPDQRDEIILQRCRMLLDVWRGSEAVEDLEQLLTRKQASDDRDGELEAQRWMARAYYVMSLDRQGYSEKVKDAYNRTIELAKELGNDKTRAHILVATAQLVDYDRSFFSTAQKNLEEAQKIGEQLDDEEIRIEVATARLNASFSDDTDQLGEEVLKFAQLLQGCAESVFLVCNFLIEGQQRVVEPAEVE
jgi:tetratricopeptide (TPR) repeat protein